MSSVVKYILLALPYFFMVAGVTIYARVNPELGGIPFFYWYQLVWIFIAAALTSVVYFIENSERKRKVTS